MFISQHRLYLNSDHVDSDEIVPAPRNDDIGPVFARLHKLKMHGLDGGHVLVHDGIDRSSPFKDVTPDPPKKPFIGVRIDKHFDVHKVAKLFFDKDQDPLDDDDVLRLQPPRFLPSGVGREIV